VAAAAAVRAVVVACSLVIAMVAVRVATAVCWLACTLVVRLGRRAARIQFGVSLAAAFLVPVVLVARGVGMAVLLPCLLVPWGWIQVRRLKESRAPSELIALLGDTGRLLAAYALLFAAGLAFGG